MNTRILDTADIRPSYRPITPLQNGMLYHAMTRPGRGVDIEQISFDIREDVDFDRFAVAWNRVIAEHEILRTAFRWQDVAEPVSVVDSSAAMSAVVNDWRSKNADQQASARSQIMRADRLDDFDLATAPLMRLQLFRFADDHVWGLWTFHHALLDGRSFPMVLREVFELYDNDNEPSQRPGYDTFVRHLANCDHEATREAWQSRLAGVDPAKPLRVGVDGNESDLPWYAVAERTIDQKLSDEIRRTAAEQNVSVNNLFQTAWSVLLHRYQASDDILFGTTRACRHVTEEAKDTVGLLINTVPMRVQIDRTQSTSDLMRAIADQQRELRKIETTPLHLIQKWAGIEPGADLFETLVVYDSESLNRRMQSEGKNRRFEYFGQTNYPMTLVVYGDPSMQVRLEYATSHLSGEAAERMAGQLIEILKSIVDQPTAPVGKIRYMSAADHDCLAKWNDTAVDYDLDQTLVDLFERQVEKTPHATAVRFGDNSLTYDQFNRRINQLAHYLRQRGVGPGSVVGMYAFRSIEMMIGIQAIVKAGGAYLPLDPEYPEDRLQFMVKDASADLVLCAGGTAPTAGLLEREIIDLDQPDAPYLKEPETNPGGGASPTDVAYVIYTSGSTGLPKGVLNEHRGIVNRLLWKQDAYQLDETDVVLQKTPFTFDVSVWELFWAFQTGATLAIAKPGGHRDTRYLVSEIIRCGVTTLHFVPSMLQLFAEEPELESCTSIRRVICSGEALSRDLQDRFLDRLDVELHNLYGPTEAAIDVTWWVCDRESPLPYVPIGSAIANTTMHVLDKQLEPAPPGAAGELHIGGVQVARGYLNRPELNAERFITDPYSGDRLYKTGDLGRFRADGSIEYLGRTDHQVKIRGFRIELGEIETVLSTHPAVANCVVIDREDRPGDKQIVAYYSLVSGAATEEGQLRTHLSGKLADYMVPAALVEMAELPLSPAGKINRKKLPAPTYGRSNESIEQPKSDTERKVAALWCELLGALEVDRTTPFFEAGGHSLLAIRLAARMSRAFDRDVAVTQLLSHPTVESQAKLLESEEDNTALASVSEAAKARRDALARRRKNAPARRSPRT